MKKIKKFFILLLIYSFFIIIGDFIFSNFTNFGKINYNCFQYFNLDHKKDKFHYYDLKKNCSATESQRTVSPYKVFIDNNGYRYSGKKRDDFKNKILFAGDSQTYGYGVKYQDSFPGIVASKNTDYEIYNLGVPGYGIRMYWNRVEDFFNQNNNITHVIVTIDMTDIIDLAYSWQEIPSTKYPVIKSHHVKKEIDSWDKIKDSNFKGFRLLTFYLRNLMRSTKNKLIDNYDINKDMSLKSEIANFTYTDLSQHSILDKIKFEKALNDIDKYYGKIAKISRKNNAKFYLLIFPWPENLIYGQTNFNWEDFSTSICEKHKCEKMINLFDKFNIIKDENNNWKQLIFIDDDIHLKKFGNSIVANEIQKVLQDIN